MWTHPKTALAALVLLVLAAGATACGADASDPETDGGTDIGTDGGTDSVTDSGSGGDGQGVGDAQSEPCPAGPQAPLGAVCSIEAQTCAYGYEPIECGGRTVICTDGVFVELEHTDPQPACFDAGADTGSDGGRDAG